MTVWAHFSQRPTWPPSAAVRQRSIALITFIWPRLTWPALARRHAAPWSRKMSATSRAARAIAAAAYAGGLDLFGVRASRSSGLITLGSPAGSCVWHVVGLQCSQAGARRASARYPDRSTRRAGEAYCGDG